MSFAENEAKKLGFSKIYLTTDHNGYYEKYGWIRKGHGYELSGEATRIYMKELRALEFQKNRCRIESGMTIFAAAYDMMIK